MSESIGIVSVKGMCVKHGEVDLSDQEWGWDDFREAHDEVAIMPG